jgi:hypothetical protein
MRKWVKILIIVALVLPGIGLCGWLSFTYLIMRLPARPETRAVELADLDGDGDLDAFLANGRNEAPEANTVLWNDGHGNFQDSGQRLGDFESYGVELADFDADGDLDALVSNISWGELFFNDGRGRFGQQQMFYSPAKRDGFYVGIWRFQSADLNEDGRADLFSTGCCGGGRTESGRWETLNAINAVWLSDDSGMLQDREQQFGLGNSEAVALADLDGDGDLDAFLANSGHMDEHGDMVAFDGNEVWFNDGRGVFSDSGQRLGRQRSHAVALGDLDEDGDVDALVGNRGPDEVWWNDGAGVFSQGDQALGSTLTRYAFLADLDGDGDLDALLGDDNRALIWLNDGRGHLSDSRQRLDYSRRHALAVGDVNGDGSVDLVAGMLGEAAVWLNNGAGRLIR